MRIGQLLSIGIPEIILCDVPKCGRGFAIEDNFLKFPVFQRTDTHIAFKIFAEERDVGKVQRVGDCLYGEVGRFQL